MAALSPGLKPGACGGGVLVMGLYTRPASALIEGEIQTLPHTSGLEECTFPEPVGRCETAISDAHSTAYTLKGKVRNLYEKTVRYKGHYGTMQKLKELGFLGDEPVEVQGQRVRPLDVTMEVLKPHVQGNSPEDVTVLRVVVRGQKGGNPAQALWEMVDFYDPEEGLTSMARTTAFPAALAARWVARGLIEKRGFLAPEEIFSPEKADAFLHELGERGVKIQRLR
ncbi:MAG: saccharopine dehydrogenase C-terminal domain-containing protein [Bacillota bacterium]|nr:saccharopine dehydrogenase C-terminal domain-containing protein [Bacillota bacterium]